MATPKSFYMYEVVDGGAGAIGSFPQTLFVFAGGEALVKEVTAAWDGIGERVDNEDAIESFTNRVGIGEHILWVVEEGVIVSRRALDEFLSVDFHDGKPPISMNARKRLSKRAGAPIAAFTLHLDAAAILAAFPKPAHALTKRDGAVAVTWRTKRVNSSVGAKVCLGPFMLESGEDAFVCD